MPVVARPWPASPLVMRSSSMVAAERPMLAPAYQPACWALLAGPARAAAARQPRVAAVLAMVMSFLSKREAAAQGAGTLITVFTTVTDGPSDISRPSTVVSPSAPAVETAMAACEMIVPTNVPPPPALIVAAVPTCQNTFLACAPLVRITLLGKAAPG